MRKLLLPMLALCALLVIVPAASAKPAHASKKANAAAGKTLSNAKLSSEVRKAKASIKGIGNAIKFFTAQNNDRKKGIADLNATINGIVPVVTKALTDLQGGLLALKAGLETAGAGLVSLKTLATSTERVGVQIFVNNQALPGCFVLTPDIPDNASTITAQTTCIHSLAGLATTGAVTAKATCRSSESDGTGASLPCASAGITITSTNQSLVAGAATFQGFLTSLPNGALGGAPVYDIPLKSPEFSTTETSFPFAPISSDNLVDLTTGTNSVQSGIGGGGTIQSVPTATSINEITVTVRAVDTTTSTTDPSA